MRDFEFKVLRGLLFCLLLLVNYTILTSLFSTFDFTKDFTNGSQFAGFMVTFLGLHSFFALASFGSSRFVQKQYSSYLMAGCSIVIPLMYFFNGLKQITALNISNFLIFIICIVFFDILRIDFAGNIIKRYFKVLTDLFYFSDDEIF